MTDTEDDLVISIDGEGEKIGGETQVDAVDDLKSQLETLKASEKAERDRRESAERRAAQEAQEASRAREEVKTARTEVAARELDTVLSGIAQAQAEADSAQKDVEAAAEAGDFKKQAEAYRRLAKAETKLGRLDEAKADIEVRQSETSPRNRVERREGGSDQTVVRRDTSTDPVEAFVSGRSPQTQAWLRAHPEHARSLAFDAMGTAGSDDARRARKLGAAHQDALAEGLTADSPEYFQHIETFIGLKKEAANGAREQQPERQRRSSPAVAPVSQTGAGNGGNGGTQVRLSSFEAAAATDGTIVWNPGNRHPETGKPIKRDDPIVGTPVGHREFAKRKLEMQKDGAYNKNLESN